MKMAQETRIRSHSFGHCVVVLANKELKDTIAQFFRKLYAN